MGCVVPYSAWDELRKLRAAQAADAKARVDGGESLLGIPRGKYPKLDTFDDLLENGARVAKQQRKWLVSIPLGAMVLTFALSFAIMVQGEILTGAAAPGLSPAEVQKRMYKVVLVVNYLLIWGVVLLLASLSPTNIKGLCYTCIGLIAVFTFCALVVCTVLAPAAYPDRTGTVFRIFMFCTMVKCIGFVSSLIWALLTQPPRKCLRVMEWGGMGVIIGFGTINTLAAYYCIKDSEVDPPPDFWFLYAMQSAASLFLGILTITKYPRVVGRFFLKKLHRLSSPTTSFDFQCLAATIAVMVGADSNFRAILCKAVDALRAVSMADVSWDEFKANSPDTRCFEKSRPVTFDQVDFFLSHSWSDDPHAKWDAVQKLRADFKAKNGREPLVWFDKYCIDQTAIDESVRRLPIFVVASSKFVVLLGSSYASRCWCMLELFVFNSVVRSGLFQPTDLVIAPLKNKDSGRDLERLAQTFNIHDTQCLLDRDRQTILGIVETAGDGHEGFDAAVRALAAIAAAEVPPSEGAIAAGEMPPSEDQECTSGGTTGWYRAGGAVHQELIQRGHKTSVPPSPPVTRSPPLTTSPPETQMDELDATEDVEAGLGEDE